MLISKKDLLAVTGISYGQLYRWKREGLIPEEWFIKKSSYTGQETFFPRDQAISRIQTILELKDTYSLEEMAEIFAKGHMNTVYTVEEVQKINLIRTDILNEYLDMRNESKLSFTALIYLAALSKASNISKGMGTELEPFIEEGRPVGKKLMICRLGDRCFCMITELAADFVLGGNVRLEAEINLEQMADKLKSRLNQTEKKGL